MGAAMAAAMAPGPGLPAAFAAVFAPLVDGLKQLQGLSQQMHQNQLQMQQQMQQMQQQLLAAITAGGPRPGAARAANAAAHGVNPLIPVPGPDGAIPAAPMWPAGLTRAGIVAMPSAALNALLAFYGLAIVGTLQERKDRLLVHVGVIARE